jgi:hypothetical protein
VGLSVKIAAVAETDSVRPQEEEAIPAQILAVIAAAATAFLAENARLRSPGLLHSPLEPVSKWSQQGRAFVRASHNLPSKR